MGIHWWGSSLVFHTMVQRLKNFEKMAEAESYSDCPFPSPLKQVIKNPIALQPGGKEYL